MFRRLMVLATMLAMVLLLAVPASAQLIVIDDVADLDVELCLAIQAGLPITVTGDVNQDQVQSVCNDFITNNFFFDDDDPGRDDRGRGGGDNGGNGGGDNGGSGANGGGGANGDGGGGGGAALTQEDEQETESGDVDQSFNITGGGDNSSQCVGFSGVAQTGNAQNQIDLIQYASTADDFEFDEVGSNVDVSPANTTECDQAVQQSAAASSL
jgi:hypothetical protein